MPSFRIRRTLCRARICSKRIRRPFPNDSTVRPLSQSLTLDGFDARRATRSRQRPKSQGLQAGCCSRLGLTGVRHGKRFNRFCLQCIGRPTNAVQYPLGLACRRYPCTIPFGPTRPRILARVGIAHAPAHRCYGGYGRD
jgi:hypothetical protein